ncbi:uncharacterized protein TNIN_78391 [Trichonephila inaurata madagascariensis]|uniref:Uncharacterized protein n=1 Tax=Trichonephila inaurata madagascariensis TaxID=2747483 RepID=A0A8X6Y088_9ARAC|nr:uncharacterized protein TNIN_78391 [Trichonephila inaurata madagascariensis]
MKVKLLSQLVSRYQKIVRELPEPVRVSVVEKEPEKNIATNDCLVAPRKPWLDDAVMVDIVSSEPQYQSKFLFLTVEKLKTCSYFWNDLGEMTRSGESIKISRIVDFFLYTIRNSEKQVEPKHFEYFLQALKERNVPHSCISNQKVLGRLIFVKGM